MEVRQQRVHPAELEAGRHEQRGAAAERRAARERLEHAHGGRSDREHPLGSLDPLPGVGRDLVALAVQHVLLDRLRRQGPERVEADVQRHALDVERREQLVGEMEPCRRRRGGALASRVDGLVALGSASGSVM